MPELLAALEAFVQEHRRCGELEAAWMIAEYGGPAIAEPGSCIRSSPGRTRPTRSVGSPGRSGEARAS